MAMNFPLRTDFAVSVLGCCEFVFICFQKVVDFFPNLVLTHSLFNSMQFSLHDFECFGLFLLGLVSSFSPLWSEKMLDMFSIFLNLLRVALCPITWSIF